ADEHPLELWDGTRRALIQVLVGVDEAGQHDEAVAVDDPVAAFVGQPDADVHDDVTVDQHVAAGQLGAVVVERGHEIAAAQEPARHDGDLTASSGGRTAPRRLPAPWRARWRRRT